MRYLGLSALVAAAAFLFPACQGGTGGANSSATGGPMYILTCSLGCPSGAGGLEVHCTPISIAPNQEFVVTFSRPVDASSVTSETFSIIDTLSGATPLGTRLVDPVDTRRVIFRPAITFDSQGNPSFGFASNASYSIAIKGTGQDPTGPYIRSTGGDQNTSRMSCQLATTSTPVDYVPGPPSVNVQVDLADLSTQDPNDFIADQPAANAVNVWRNSTIRLIFDDIMNPVTLANQATHSATFVTVKVDVDGDLSTTADQVTLAGIYVVTVDLTNLQTILTFTSGSGMPSSGDPALNPLPRLVLVSFPSAIQDLAGNPLSNAGSLSFTPEFVAHAPTTLPDADGENFNDTVYDQADISGATWGNGRLTRGWGGGSGRLGALRVRVGGPVDLSTDSQLFPLDPTIYTSAVSIRDLLDNAQPNVDYDPLNPSSWPTITVTDGVFEFSSLTIEPGAVLKFHGNQAARVLVRGPVEIQGNGTLDVTGFPGAANLSDSHFGSAGGSGGPFAGAGGGGSDRFDNTGHPTLLALGGIANPGADYNGAPGGGVGQVAGLGAAHGGQIYPQSNLLVTSSVPASVNGGLCWTFDDVHFPTWQGCQCLQPGAPGGGATYGDGTNVIGGSSVANTPILLNETNNSNLPPVTAPGSGIPIEPPDPQSGHVVRVLDFYAGNLRGGAAGGGGGLSFFGTQTTQNIQGFACGGSGTLVNSPSGYEDNSGAGGGGGGGALQLVSGTAILLDGVVDARGGAGGGEDTTGNDRQRQTAPGGGGSGGAVRLQSLSVNLAPVPGRVNITGGAGGITDTDHRPTFTLNTVGGAGSSGLVRIEDNTGLLSRATEAPYILPFDPTHIHSGSNLPESEDFLSVGTWLLPRKRPESFTASASCWLQPSDSFFLLDFIPDDVANPDPTLRYGWNMDVIYNPGTGEQLIAYRGPDPNSPFQSGDFETNLGDLLNHGLPAGQGSYLAVRFQGAKSKSSIAGNPCGVNLVAVGSNQSDIVSGSLTPWVRHPADLNSFSPRPDMVRFCVVFDTALVTGGSIGAFIKGITNLKIRTQPD